MKKAKKLSKKERLVADRIVNLFGCYFLEPKICGVCADVKTLILKHKRYIK